jgi:hypothetical protein
MAKHDTIESISRQWNISRRDPFSRRYPLRLAVAAKLTFADGSISVSGPRTDAANGRLPIGSTDNNSSAARRNGYALLTASLLIKQALLLVQRDGSSL